MADANTVIQRLNLALPLAMAGLGFFQGGKESSVDLGKVTEAVKKAFEVYGLRTYNDERTINRAIALLMKEPDYQDAEEVLDWAFGKMFGAENTEASILVWWYSNEFRKYLTDNWYLGKIERKTVTGDETRTSSENDLSYQIEFLKFLVKTARRKGNEIEKTRYQRLLRTLKNRNIPHVPDEHIVRTIGQALRAIPGLYENSTKKTTDVAGDFLAYINQKDHELELRKQESLQTWSGRFWNRFFKFF